MPQCNHHDNCPMAAFAAKISEDLGSLKTDMKALVGNGQPGRITKIESRISWAERVLYGGWGAAIAIGFLAKLGLFEGIIGAWLR